MPIQKYPLIQVKLYGGRDKLGVPGELLHSFTCKKIGEWNFRTCKAFYCNNYKTHNGAKPIYSLNHELDYNINYQRFHVRMEAVIHVHKYGELTQKKAEESDMEKKLKEKDFIIKSLRNDINSLRNDARTLSKMMGNMKKHLISTYWSQLIDDDDI